MHHAWNHHHESDNDDWFTSAFLPDPQSCSYLLQSWTPVQKRIVIYEALLSWYDPNEWYSYFSNDHFGGFVEFDSSTLKSMEPSPSLSKILNNWSKYCSPAAPWQKYLVSIKRTLISFQVYLFHFTFGMMAANMIFIFSRSILPSGQSSMNPFG